MLHDFSADAFSRITDLRFPIINKPLLSDGRAKSHGMPPVYKRSDMLMFKPPLLLQEFVNPVGVIFKVYVAGNYVQCVRRESLPDVAPEQHHSVTFSRASNTSSHNPKEVEWAELPPSSFLKKIAMGLRKATGYGLFSFDMIRDAKARNHYLIIDINYFPGYSKTENAERGSETIIVPGDVKRGPYAGFPKAALMKFSMSCWTDLFPLAFAHEGEFRLRKSLEFGRPICGDEQVKWHPRTRDSHAVVFDA
ncbi:hypothetical protein ZIOFF_014190 [Zingiber officinale]|uniref:inositol-1,3,4-trisphosphate 5/6-kinase n=1 Tax=Zingiber officinale TaxID=94328 RepID=A0A8J5HSV6_ZINOF|nr:hypothetical protein ZIOFF_014190 [Zingiber officinale]